MTGRRAEKLHQEFRLKTVAHKEREFRFKGLKWDCGGE